MSKIKVGDKVMWKGAWGSESAIEATITDMSLVKKGEKYGDDCTESTWDNLDHIVVGLDNGHWSYGYQLEKIKK